MNTETLQAKLAELARTKAIDKLNKIFSAFEKELNDINVLFDKFEITLDGKTYKTPVSTMVKTLRETVEKSTIQYQVKKDTDEFIEKVERLSVELEELKDRIQ